MDFLWILVWLRYPVDLGLWASLCVGIYVRWKHCVHCWTLAATAVLCVGIIAAGLAIKVKYSKAYMFELSRSFCSMLVLGMIALQRSALVVEDPNEMIMNYMLAGSLVAYVSWAAAYKSSMRGPPEYDNSIISLSEVASLLGMATAILLVNKNTFALLCSLCCLGLFVISVRRLATLFVIIQLPFFIYTNYMLIASEESLAMNWEALSIYLGLLLTDPFVDAIVTRKSALERWQPLMGRRPIFMKLFILMVFVCEISSLCVTASTLGSHKEWILVIPLFAVLSVVFWIPFHIANFITQWKLINRVSVCYSMYQSLNDENRSLSKLLASKGLRHFSLISYPLVWLSFFSHCILFVWSWTTKTPESTGLFLVCLPVQLMTIAILRILSIKLGGTCCGYALVSPAMLKRTNNMDLAQIQINNSYATGTLHLIQQLYMHHLVEDGGCIYSSEMPAEEELKQKLTEFFSRRLADNASVSSAGAPAFDTYVLYFSGPVNEVGDWILKGNQLFTYEKLLTWWTESGLSEGSRLILILDTVKSNLWVPKVRKTLACVVGCQTLYVTREAEAIGLFNIGDFTRDYVEFNCTPNSQIYSESFQSPIVVTYGISPNWSDFRFHEPTSDEVEAYWQANFPKVMQPLMNIIKWCSLSGLSDRLFCCCFWCTKMFARILLMWRKTKVFDIGHGFQLVRHFKLPPGGFL